MRSPRSRRGGHETLHIRTGQVTRGSCASRCTHSGHEVHRRRHQPARRDLQRGYSGVQSAARVRLHQLADQYACGVGALREALNRLVGDGLVISEEQRGFSVSTVSRDHLLDLLHMRLLLEEQGIRRSIELGAFSSLRIGLRFGKAPRRNPQPYSIVTRPHEFARRRAVALAQTIGWVEIHCQWRWISRFKVLAFSRAEKAMTGWGGARPGAGRKKNSGTLKNPAQLSEPAKRALNVQRSIAAHQAATKIDLNAAMPVEVMLDNMRWAQARAQAIADEIAEVERETGKTADPRAIQAHAGPSGHGAAVRRGRRSLFASTPRRRRQSGSA